MNERKLQAFARECADAMHAACGPVDPIPVGMTLGTWSQEPHGGAAFPLIGDFEAVDRALGRRASADERRLFEQAYREYLFGLALVADVKRG